MKAANRSTVMNGKIIADTSAVISLFKGHEKAQIQFNQSEIVYLPSIVVGELYCGVYNCHNPDREISKIEKLIEKTVLLDVDYEAGKYYGEIINQLRTQGTPIPNNDVWIAAVAKQHNLPVLARDKHFKRIIDIKLISL